MTWGSRAEKVGVGESLNAVSCVQNVVGLLLERCLREEYVEVLV